MVEIGAVARGELAELCARADELLARAQGARLECRVGAGVAADLVLVDALARLRLVARRRGRAYRIRDAPPALRDLLGLIGLRGAVPVGEDAEALPVRSGLQARREAEEREQVLGVQEGVEPDDPPA